MAIVFELSPKSYVWMLFKIPGKSSAYTILKNAPPSRRIHDAAQVPNYVVTCNIGEADQFLAIAKEHCLEAVAAIEQAIRVSVPPTH